MIICSCLKLAETSSLETGDVINLFGLIINTALGIFLVVIIQKRANDKRILKDHLIDEVKDLRNDYRKFYTKLEKGIKPQEIASWFKETNIKSIDLLELIELNNPKIRKNFLRPFQKDLKDLISDFPEYENNYFSNSEFKLKSSSIIKIQRFKQVHNNLFNKLIVAINNGK